MEYARSRGSYVYLLMNLAAGDDGEPISGAGFRCVDAATAEHAARRINALIAHEVALAVQNAQERVRATMSAQPGRTPAQVGSFVSSDPGAIEDGLTNLDASKALATGFPARRCVQCEGPLVHERLAGYVCPRGCRP